MQTVRATGMYRERLTPRQAEMLRLITHWIRVHGHSPTVREIGNELGIRSPNGVSMHLNELQRKGWIRRIHRASRSIRVVGCCPCCGRPDDDDHLRNVKGLPR